MSAPTAGRLLLRQARAEAATLVALAVTTLLVAGVLAAWPRAVDRMVADDLAQQVAAQSALDRDLTLPAHPQIMVDTVPGPAEVAAGMDGLQASADAQTAGAGPALRELLTTARFAVERAVVEIERGPRAPDIAQMSLTVLIDPGLPERVRWVAGAAPAPYDAGAAAGRPLADATGDLPAVEVVLSVAAAEALRWDVGETRRSLDRSFPVDLRLSGTFEAVDPADGSWRHLPSALGASVVDDLNAGVLVTGVGFADPGALAALVVPNGTTTRYWHPLDVSGVADVDREALIADLQRVRADQGLRSGTTDVLIAGRAREATVTSLLDVLAVGMSGAAVGVLWLAAVLAVERRRSALALLRARGASGIAVRGLVAAQGLLVTLPAGAVGIALGMLAVPGATRPADLLPPAAAVLAPTVLLAVAAGRVTGRAGRADVGSAPWRWRWVAEALVVVAAVVSVVVTRQRGLAGATGGADPLVSALPVVLGLAAAVLVLRLYPWPVRGLLGLVRRRPGASGFLGAAQAARSPAAGLVPVVALVLGVATVALSAVTLSTVAAGSERSAVRSTGADVRLDLAVRTASGGGLTEEQVAAARGVEGVAALAAVGDAGRRSVEIGRTSGTAAVVVVDAAALAEVQAGLPGVAALPGALAGAGDGGALPVVLAAGLGAGPGQAAAVLVGATPDSVDVDPAAVVGEVPGVVTGQSWVLVDRAAWTARTGLDPVVDRLLVRVAPGADPQEVAAALTAALDDPLTVRTVAGARAELDRSVLVTGTRTALLVVTGVSALLCAGVLALLLLTGAPARGRTTALLRTLGAPASVGRGLVAAEVAGPVVVSAAGGLLVAAVLPRLVLGAADLRLFTGAAERADLVVDPATVAAVAGAGLVVCAVALAVAVAAARRVAAVEVLREGA